MRSYLPAPPPPEPDVPLTERAVDVLARNDGGMSVMALAIALRAPYPLVEAELLELEALGVVVRSAVRGRTRWRLG